MGTVTEIHTAGTLALRDGTTLAVRPIRPGDRDALARGFAALSPESRKRRFLVGKDKLTERELTYLTDVDHRSHEALVAYVPETGEGVGVARYAGWSASGGRAEIAFTVADAWHGRGVASALCARLLDRAREEGVAVLEATTDLGNLASQALLFKLGFAFTDYTHGLANFELRLAAGGALAAAA